MTDRTITTRSVVAIFAGAAAATAGSLAVVAQVKTNVPDVVLGARSAIVEHIKIHGAVRFQDQEIPFFSRTLSFEPATR